MPSLILISVGISALNNCSRSRGKVLAAYRQHACLFMTWMTAKHRITWNDTFSFDNREGGLYLIDICCYYCNYKCNSIPVLFLKILQQSIVDLITLFQALVKGATIMLLSSSDSVGRTVCQASSIGLVSGGTCHPTGQGLTPACSFGSGFSLLQFAWVINMVEMKSKMSFPFDYRMLMDMICVFSKLVK